MINFEGKTIIVTGAASGIGNATARLLNERGARCLLLDKDGELLEKNNPSPEKNVIRTVDLTDFKEVHDLVSQTKSEFYRGGGGTDSTGSSIVQVSRRSFLSEFSMMTSTNASNG